MTCLPDVNVWIALTVAEHVHHQAALKWIEAVVDDTIAFCRVTEMGLLRLLTNPKVMADNVYTAREACRIVGRIRDDDRIVFAFEPAGLEPDWRAMTAHHKTGANFWTDTYLAAFAQAAEYTLVTFDRGFRKYRGLSVHILV